MANNKKVFIIEINGIEKASKEVDILDEKLQLLNKRIKNLEGASVKLPISEEKEYAKALVQREKALEAVNKEIEGTNKNLKEFKQQTKDLVALETKARNETKGYANTLNGLKQELKDLNSTKGNIDLGSDEFIQISERIYEITQRLKDYESAMGSHGRNVGNYTESIKEALREIEGFADGAETIAMSADDIKNKFDELKNIDLNYENIKDYNVSISDLKKLISELENEISTLNIGSNEWQTANNKLTSFKQTLGLVQKDMEAAIRAEDQINTKIKMNVNGMTLEFDDVNQGVGILEDKLYKLAASGKKNTKEFENLARAAAELKTQVRQVDYEIDAMVESSRGIQTMVSYAQGFTAIAQGAVGIGNLFGADNENSLKGIQTLQALQGIAMSLQTIQQMSQQGSAFGKMLDNWIKKLQALQITTLSFNSSFGKMQELLNDAKGANDFSKTITTVIANTKELREEYVNLISKMESKGINVVGKDTASLGESLMDAYHAGKLTEEEYTELDNTLLELDAKGLKKVLNSSLTLKDAFGSFKDNLKNLGTSFKNFGSTILYNAKNFKTYIKQLLSFNENGVKVSFGLKAMTTAFKGLTVATKAFSAALKATVIFAVIQALISLIGWLGEGLKKLNEWVFGNDKLTNSLDTLEGRLESVNNRLERYLSLLNKSNQSGQTSDIEKSAKQFDALQEAIKYACDELQRFIKLRNKSKKLEDNFSDDGLTQTWDFKSIEQFRREYEKLLRAVESGTDVKQQGGSWWEKIWYTESDAKSDLGVMQKRVIEDIQYQINNLDLSKGTEELEAFFELIDTEMYTTSLMNVESLFPEEEWVSVLKQRIDQLRTFLQQASDYSAEFENVAYAKSKTIRDNITEAIADSQKRELEVLNNQRIDEIRAAKGDNEIILSIEQKYRQKRRELLDRQHKENLDKQQQYYKYLVDEYEKYLDEMRQLELANNAAKTSRKSDNLEVDNQLKQMMQDYTYYADYDKRIAEEKEFYETRLGFEVDYINKKHQLENEFASNERDSELYNEQKRNKQRLDELTNAFEEKKITQADYNRLIEREQEIHKAKEQSINDEYNHKIKLNEKNHRIEIKEIISSSLNDTISIYELYFKEINDLLQNNGNNINVFGITDYSKTKENFDKALQVVKDGIVQVDNEMLKLEDKKSKGEISIIDYKQAKEDLENTKKELQTQGKEIADEMSHLLGDIAMQWKGLIDNYVNQISSFLSLMNETQMQMIDNELAEIEHQLEIQEEAYARAEEAANTHKDKINDIEDELAEARGSRRQALIDNLAAQQEAYLEDVAAKQQAEQEKQKLEEKQRALEKKRKEQEKKSKVQQAMMNTYMAVSNALAVTPWPLGLALSAVALALGLKNVAAIKSTPIYEDGGVIQGARHSQGGVKVLGGQAEVEGGEYITNRKSTKANLPLLEYINAKKREVTIDELIKLFDNGTPKIKSKVALKFKEGGVLPTTDIDVRKVVNVANVGEDNRSYVVSVVDIIDAQENLEKVKVLSGLADK